MQLCGTEVYIKESGEKGRNVLLLHGWGCSTELMASVQDHLSAGMHTVCIDFPAHGKSGRPPEPWGVPEFMELVAQLIREKGLAPCDIVAHSFGGRVAILLAATYPELVGRMVLTGAAGIRKPEQEKNNKRGMYTKLRGVVDLMEKTHLFGSLPQKGREALIQKFGSADYKALDPEMRKTFNKVISQDLSAYLPQIKASTLLYWGANDDATPLWMGQEMETQIPDAGLVVEPGAGHFAYLEHSAKFLRILDSFLLEGRE